MTLPQKLQKIAPSGFSYAQLGHFMVLTVGNSRVIHYPFSGVGPLLFPVPSPEILTEQH